MKVVDANVLIYAADARSRLHRTAREWLDTALKGPEAIGLTWVVLLAFVRVTTNPQITQTPLTVDQSAELLESWLALPAVVVLEPTLRHFAILSGLLAGVGTGGNLVNDAHLAAIALEHGGEVASFDTDFARFPGLQWHRLG